MMRKATIVMQFVSLRTCTSLIAFYSNQLDHLEYIEMNLCWSICGGATAF